MVKTSHKLVFSLGVTLAALAIMSFTVTPFSQNIASCCNQFALEAAYGFPFAFRSVYSGGFTGLGQTVFSGWALALDFGMIFSVVLAITVLLTQPMVAQGRPHRKTKRRA
ncbi:hypothetical protein HYX70_00950 [Candidatus Saccharibacteria bacterium]|nr:hypothetical protein [Candidatus Saccharibacteria bacterium]